MVRLVSRATGGEVEADEKAAEKLVASGAFRVVSKSKQKPEPKAKPEQKAEPKPTE